MTTPITRFYSGEMPDHRGRFLSEIQEWNFAKLEAVHDFIQWLFPLPEPSPVNPLAPVLDPVTIQEFHDRQDLREALRQSLRVMIAFYGFALVDSEPPVVRALPGIEKAHWLSPGDHNLLRITRILRSTRLLGLGSESRAFFGALDALYGTDAGRPAIGSVSFQYWQDAAHSSKPD